MAKSSRFRKLISKIIPSKASKQAPQPPKPAAQPKPAKQSKPGKAPKPAKASVFQRIFKRGKPAAAPQQIIPPKPTIPPHPRYAPNPLDLTIDERVRRYRARAQEKRVGEYRPVDEEAAFWRLYDQGE